MIRLIFLASATVLSSFILTSCGSSTGAQPGSADNILSNPGDVPVVLGAGDPAFDVPVETLAAALECSEFNNPDKEPILLVHGTGTNGPEQYEWNWLPFLRANNFDVCVTTYPGRGLGDQQDSAEYVVYAILAMQQLSGRKVDMAGHSQGASMPRWAIRWWPSAREALDDFVLHAGPNHGTQVAGSANDQGQRPPAAWQFATDSNFVRAVNSVDETPGTVDYTSIYAFTDQLVQPVFPVATAALDVGVEEANTVNIALQEVCPGRSVDHVTIGTTDSATLRLTLDAFTNDGPADFERAGGLDICIEQSFADPAAAPEGFSAAGADLFASIPTDTETVDNEPPLKPYAQGF